MQQNNFFNRMRRAFTLTILIPVIVLIGLYSYILFVSNEKRLRDVCSNQTQMVATHINGLVSHMDFITMDLISHIDFLDSIKQFYFDSKATAQKYIEIADNMVPYKYFQTIYEITYLEERGYYCSTSIPIREYYKVHQIPTEPFLSSAWYRKSLAAKGAPVFVNIGPEGTDRSEGSMFALARSVTVPQRTIGCLYVQVDLSKNNDVLEPLYDYGATWAVYASDGTRLCCDDQYPDIQLDLQSYGEESTQIVKNAGAEKYMVSVSAGENGNFYVAAVYPLRLMWQEPVWNLLPYLVLTVIILAVAFYFIDRYSKLLSDPLSQLADMMQKTTLDNLKQPHHFYTENLPDEIISLYQSYSVMSDRITDMVQDKINWMKKMAEQRYRYLQYQINPHFLYNTLNVIGIMGEEAGQRSVFEACKTLTHLLRYSLVDFMKPSTFQEEFSSIHAYLNLMKLRLIVMSINSMT